MQEDYEVESAMQMSSHSTSSIPSHDPAHARATAAPHPSEGASNVLLMSSPQIEFHCIIVESSFWMIKHSLYHAARPALHLLPFSQSH